MMREPEHLPAGAASPVGALSGISAGGGLRHMATLLVALVLPGCFTPGKALTDEMPEDLPAGSCEDTDTDACASSSGTAAGGATSGGGSTGTAAVEGCDAEACLGGDACVAEWDAVAQSRGPFVCRFACVPLVDDTAWCHDDAACCDASARCTERGYCVLPESDGAGSGSSSEGSAG